MVHLVWIIPLFLGGFAGLWWLLCHGIALAGWRRLATEYASEAEPAPTARFRLWRASVGWASYHNVITAEVSPAGLRLRVATIFRVGHPPLLIPWASVGAVGHGQRFWARYYYVPIHRGADTIELRFTEDAFARALYL